MRVFMVMLGFNHPAMIKGALENLDQTTTFTEHKNMVRVLARCGYPLPEPKETDRQIAKLGAEYGWHTLPIENAGVVENHNTMIHQYCHLEKGDYYVTFDPDVRMQQKGWVTAMIKSLESDENTVFCCAARPYHDEAWCIAEGHFRCVGSGGEGFRTKG